MPDAPAYAIIVPAYNEQAQLPRTLPAIQAAMAGVQADSGVRGELIVVDNNSTDATAQVAKDHGARVVFEPVNMIAKARNAGGKATQAPNLIFVDADTAPSSELLAAALAALDSGEVCVGGAKIEMDPPTSWLAHRFLGFWNLVSKWFGLPAGCFFFCLKEGFDQVEGFNEQVYASEEIWLARKLKKWGKPKRLRATILPECVVTSSRKTDSPLRVFTMLAVMFLFPFAVRFKGLCGYWYKRDVEQA